MAWLRAVEVSSVVRYEPEAHPVAASKLSWYQPALGQLVTTFGTDLYGMVRRMA